MTITRLPNETTEQYIARLEAAVAVKPSTGRISFKVSEKGALSVYGMGRFPVTLYKEQWAKLAELMPDVLAFAKQNDSKLKTKGEETTQPTPPAAPAAAPRGEVLPPEVGQLIQ